MICIYISFVMLFFLASVAVWSYIYEYRSWNGGFCRENGYPWEYFATDSQGGRGYISGRGTDRRRYLWVSIPRIDRPAVYRS